MELSVIIVSFNTRELLKRCLNSVISDQWSVARKKRPVTNHQSLVTEIIVVDNASADGSAEMVKKEFPQLKLIGNRENLGFAKAVNQGLRIATDEYVLLLNSDTVLKEDTIKKLLDFAKKEKDIGIIGARLLNPTGSPQASVYHLPTLRRAFDEYWLGKKGSYEKYLPFGDNLAEVEAVTGAAMLIPKSTIEKIGLLNERYFMYFEDLDFCRRVTKAGLKVYYLPQAEVIHHHGASGQGSSATYRYLVKSSKIYNGLPKYWLLSFIIWSGQKWRKLIGKS